MRRVKAAHIVYANWCPHCVPTTVEQMKKVAKELGVQCILYDIDTDAVKKADELVGNYGDWSEDYLIPQVFFEFNSGEYKHILTGYSEGVEYTSRAVNNLLSSQFYSTLKAQQSGSQSSKVICVMPIDSVGTIMDLKTVVEKILNGPLKCYGHCDKQGVLKFLPVINRTVACFICPSGYVSRVSTYGKDFDLTWFKGFLTEAVKEIGEVTNQDIRVATRHPWDLGIPEETGDVVLRQAYWTQNYGRTKSTDPNRIALFLCTKCSSLYHQPLTSQETLCMNCREGKISQG